MLKFNMSSGLVQMNKLSLRINQVEVYEMVVRDKLMSGL